MDRPKAIRTIDTDGATRGKIFFQFDESRDKVLTPPPDPSAAAVSAPQVAKARTRDSPSKRSTPIRIDATVQHLKANI